MGQVTYKFEPNEEVYVIDTCDGKSYVCLGEVIRVIIEILKTETNIMYDIRKKTYSGTTRFEEKDVFPATGSPLVPDVFAEYQNRITQ